MNWILLGVIVLLAHKEYDGNFFGMASPSPLRLPGHTQNLSPFIKHWEAANFDRTQLHAAHQKHIEQKRHRRKRELLAGEYGPSHTIRLSFFAHDREFRLVLRQDPLSVFATDVEIENTVGPMDYDISRIYTGSLEDDENSHVHAILTSDNLLDGTIETSSEQFYIEPSHRYSKDLSSSGVHSIVYKLSDVNMPLSSSSSSSSSTTTTSDAKKSPAPGSPTTSSSSLSSSSTHSGAATEHCASERLRRSMLLDDLKRRKRMTFTAKSKLEDIFSSLDNGNKVDNSNDISISHNRRKRWLPDEQVPEDRNPPLPLDLDVPYNDDYSILSHDTSSSISNSNEDVSRTFADINRSPPREQLPDQQEVTWRNNLPHQTTSTRNRNIIVSNYDPSSDISHNNNNTVTYNTNNGIRKTFTKHKNILVSSFNNRSLDDSLISSADGNFMNNFFNTNWTTMFNGGSSTSSNSGSSRPSHKTHVEIITKNGATKKPNIIVNNYNPDDVVAQNFNGMLSRTSDMHDQGSSAAARAMYDRKITCMLYLQADHTFFQKMGSDESSIEAITRHVQRANSIYKNTDFNGDGKADNITFMIKRIKVHNANALKDPGYRFPGNYGVEKFLELFSEEDYDAFCLAYMFTYRDFEMGTLGLAWTGDLKNAGGVCEKNGHYRGSLKSLNTGIVTLLNYGKHVPPAVSHVTLAHEIGHNFGSPHDPEQCTPGGEDGNYIMFARATSGDKRNNNKFSPCSLKSIEPVLNAKARSVKGCFTEPQTSICGNGVVEPGEQCDCGWEEDCKDSCCFPMSRHARLDERPCTLTPRAMCSPSQGPCCTTDCKLKFGDKCRDDNGCRDPSFCDGRMPQCPASVNKPNKTICNKEFVCYMGECTGSICLAYGLESCQCIPGPNDPKTKSCELCCKQPGEGQPCRSSFQWNEPPFDVPDMFAKPGTPCNDYNGYCDVFQKCREVDPSGPLATLRKLLLSEESIASFKKWIQTNWYTVALAIVGVFLLLVLSTKLLAKRSNLKLKSVTIIHSATTETVRLPEDNNGVIVHTAVRTKVPFKKKVRGERTVKTKLITKTANGLTPLTSSNSKQQNLLSSKTQRDAILKKPTRKKNRVAAPIPTKTAPAPPTATTEENVAPIAKPIVDSKSKSKSKPSKKHKEIIDYSNGSRLPSSGHTNTFGKVHKWLLESPIVSQPLSHIEHSSKVRKVMSKSQSTPERLVQKSPQKTKSVGNLSNEKVKLQVVYKPPFKFSLRLSKNSAVKTHVIGSGLNKIKRKSRSSDKKRVNATAIAPDRLGSERGKRTAFLLRQNVEEENQVLTNSSEPNYETLNPKNPLSIPTEASSPLYENMLPASSDLKDPKPSTSKPSGTRMSRSSSNTTLNAMPQAQPHSYSRSNSISNQSTASKHPATRKYSDNSVQLSRNFGSTQNLIHPSSSQTNLSKSKKRSSLNLKTSASAAAAAAAHFQPPTKRSNSNLNLRRENSTSKDTETPSSQQPPPLKHSSSNNAQQSAATAAASASAFPLPQLLQPQRGSIARGSFSNIPRASLNFQRQSSQPSCSNNINSSFNKHYHSISNNSPHTATCDESCNPTRPFDWTQALSGGAPNSHSSNSSGSSNQDKIKRTSRNSASPGLHNQFQQQQQQQQQQQPQQQQHQQQQQLPSDLEVMVSDVENLVS